MELRIELSRPLSLLAIIVAFGVFFVWVTSSPIPQQEQVIEDSKGGDTPPQIAIRTAEDEVRRARLEQALIGRHEQVLRYQLERLEHERSLMQGDLSEEKNEEFRRGLRELIELLEDKRKAEDKLLKSFREMWEANLASIAASALGESDPSINLTWPVEPVYGISALFEDKEYEKIFGMPHKAIDIPALQDTAILAADDGIVEQVVDNGLGYSWLTVRHKGYATVYGHIRDFYVAEGDAVLRGDPLAASGGMPGDRGAGTSTGPHLHFEVVTGAGQVNPLEHLPAAGVTLRE